MSDEKKDRPDDAPPEGELEQAPDDAGMSLEAAWHAAGDRAEGKASDGENLAPEGDELDPELVELSRRKRRRHPVISALVIALGGYLLYFNASDFTYYFASNTPQDLGEVDEALKTPEKLVPNRYVSLRGAPDRKHALMIQGRISGYDSFFRLRGGKNRIFVQRHRTKRSSGRTISAAHTGRLVRFDSLPYHRAVRNYFAKNTSVAHDFDFDTLRGKKSGDKALDKSGLELQLESGKLFWVNVTYPDEWIIQFSKQIYPDRATAAKELATIDVPFAADDEPSPSFWRFVVLTRGEQAKKLMNRFGVAKKNTGFLRRQVSYSARYDQLRFEADALVITAKDETFPSRFVVRKEGEKEVLAPAKPTPVRIPKSAVLYITASSKFHIPDDALVLLAGEVPKDKWLYLLLYALLGAFVAFNALALINRARGR